MSRCFTSRIPKELYEASRRFTQQSPFPQTTKCCECGKTARLIALLEDDKRDVSLMLPSVTKELEGKGPKTWPHDVLDIANYYCPKCGGVTSLWNQA